MMTTAEILTALLLLIAGIGIFLVACQMMSSNLESASSNKLKNLFSRASGSKLLGVGIGAVGTAAIQSSGATTVMVIGFVNAGIVSLAQAATMIYGANIGTTVTAQIVALGMFGNSALSTSVIFSALAGFGSFMMILGKRDIIKKTGGILTGFGMLFVGLDLMSDSMAGFAALDSVKIFLAHISNPFLLVLIGAVFTAIIQSSSVMTSIAIAMVYSGLISLDQGIFLTMGSNIGSCVVAILAGITSGKNAKRTALIHLMFNCSGVVIFMIAYYLFYFIGGITFGGMFESVFPGVPQTQLAMFHTFFNVMTVVIVLPLTGMLVKIVCRIVPDKPDNIENPDAPRLFFIDDNMLKTPPVAVEQTKKEIVNMAGIAMGNFNRSLEIICNMDFSEENDFAKDEKELNFLNYAIVNFVVKLSEKQQLSEEDHIYLSSTFRTVRDIERIGDYAENIVEYAVSLKNSNSSFSKDAIKEIMHLRDLINDMYEKVMRAYTNGDMFSLGQADAVEEEVDIFTKQMEDKHIERLSEGICSPSVGSQYLSLSSNAERVADHLMNVGKTIRTKTME